MTDWIADSESGSSVRGKLNAILNNGSVETVTTGAAPVECDPLKEITFIVSGGTAGDEIINLPDFDYNISAYGDPTKIGKHKIFVLLTQTDPADVVKIRASGAGGYDFSAYDNVRNRIGTCAEGVLDYQASSFEAVWVNAEWAFNFRSFDNSSSISGRVKYVPAFGDGISAGVSNGIPLVWNGSAAQYVADAGCVNGVQLITTGASPVAADPNVHATRITTGGTAGTETLSFNIIPVQEGGAEHVFKMVAVTDPADVLSIDPAHIKTAGDGAIASITMSSVNDILHVKLSVLGWWRVVEGTAVVTPV